MKPTLMDETDCENLFDQIDDLIEFPTDDNCGGGDLVCSSDSQVLANMWNGDGLPNCDPLISSSHVDSHSPTDLSAELSVPYEDIIQLEWLSNFVEDSFSGGGMTLQKENLCTNKELLDNQFHTSTPVSYLESTSSSSSSCSVEKTVPLSPPHRGPQRARSKRPRPATFTPRAVIQLISQASSSTESASVVSSESNNLMELPPTKKIPLIAGAEKEKKKKIKMSSPVDPATVRKCMHCEITKTPQWRAGPMGPKSLCNACGVRYKSGRLFPEYRPAASPTFVPSLHSNSHKKVLEMRSNVLPGSAATTTQIAVKPELVPHVPL